VTVKLSMVVTLAIVAATGCARPMTAFQPSTP
jgi:hypothetical protein